METKWCPTCEDTKPLSDFGKNKRKKDGLEYQCRLCVNARQRMSYRKNPEKKIAATRKYHVEHPEWSRAALRRSHENHRKERYERYVERGKDPEIANLRREATRRCESRRRAIKADTTADLITSEEYAGILNQYGNSCWICERPLSLEILHWDHYQPLSKGGKHTVGNLRPACSFCNVRKNARWPFTDEMKEALKSEYLLVQNSGKEVMSNVNLLR